MSIPRGTATRGVIRVIAAAPVLASLLAVSSATGAVPSIGGCAEASSVHHAALVVEHGGGRVVTACVPFSADSITGDQLLAQSGVEYATAAYPGTGNAVCQLDGEPAQYPPSCWTASSPYWAMYVSRGGGQWTFSSLGVSSQTFRDGDAEGFRYEAQGANLAPPPAAGVCPPPPGSTPAPTAIPATPPPAAARGTPATSSPGVPVLSLGAGVAAGASPSDVPSALSVRTPAGAVALSRAAPPGQPPPSSSAGVWLGAVLGGPLLVLLAMQVVRSRRHRPLP